MSIEELLSAQVKESQETNALLRQLVEAQTGDLVNVEEAVRRLSISRATIMRRIAEGLFIPYRDGRTTRVSLAQIRQAMQDEAK